MNSNIETELKVLVNKDEFNMLKSNYDLTFIKQINTYFDTRDFQLRKQGCAMRIRERENQFLFTLKTPDVNGHVEHECIVNGKGVEALQDERILALLKELHLTGEFVVIGELVTQRGVVQLESAELCFDINEYNNTVDYEIEYEYKFPHDGRTVFNEILKPIHKTYIQNCKSKIARACGL